MTKKANFYTDFSRTIFKEKWEQIGFLIGAMITLVSTPDLHLSLQIGFAIFSLAILWSIIIFAKATVRELREKHIPLLVIVGRDDDDLASAERLVIEAMEPFGFDPITWDTLYNLELSELTIFRRTSLPQTTNSWLVLTRQFTRKINKINAHYQLKGRRIYHVFLYSPAALAVGLGAVVGTKNCVVIHHYQNGHYFPVLNFEDEKKTNGIGVRIIRQTVPTPYKHIAIIEPENFTATLMVVIQLSSAAHDPVPHVMELAKTRDSTVACIRGTANGVIDVNEDWIAHSREIVSAISRWIVRPEVNHIELFFNCPVPIAFVVGMGLGIQSKVTINNWFSTESRYASVLELNKLYDNI